MSLAWFLWYGLKIGLKRNEALDMPIGLLMDLIAIEQIKHEGLKAKGHSNSDVPYDEIVIPDLK